MSTTAPQSMEPVAVGVEDGIRWAACHSPLYGAVNGYVLIPEGHPWHDLGYGAIEDTGLVDIHGGLTYDDEDSWIGFDTLHYGDNWPGSPDTIRDFGGHDWTVEDVADECRSLARQVAAAGAVA